MARRRQKMNYDATLTKLLRTKQGRDALKRYRRFWGIKYPPEILRVEMPGKGATKILVGMGRSPAVNLANGPKGSATRKVRRKHRGIVACDSGGKRIFILSGRSSRQPKRRLKRLGYVPLTEYIPTAAIEKAGSFKSRRHWIHKHDDDGGYWPVAYQDQAGNIVYGRGSYRVGKWIEK